MKKILVVLLIAAMLMSNLAFAVEIEDVTEDNWAHPFVVSVVETDLMPLDEEGNFNTGAYVTKMEVINIIYRMALLKEETSVAEVDTYLQEYQETINRLLIPQSLDIYGPDNHRAIAYALKREIVRTSELSLFFTNGRFEPISKVDASVYMAKAMNVYLEQNVNKFYEIRYKDGGEITLMAWPYINLLIEQEIVSEKGDNGYFYPNSVLKRDIMSVIASRVLRGLDGYEKETDGEDNINTFNFAGRISAVRLEDKVVEVKDQYEILRIYDASEVAISLNDQVLSLEDLEADMEVEVKVVGNKLMTLVLIDKDQDGESTDPEEPTEPEEPTDPEEPTEPEEPSEPEEPEEVVVSFSGRLSIIHYDKNIVEVRGEEDTLKVFDASEALITLNGQTISLENLEPGMNVLVETLNNELQTLAVTETYEKFEANFKEMGRWLQAKDETYTLMFFEGGFALPYLKVLQSAVVTRDFQKSDLASIEMGDRVIVHHKDGYVKQIDTFSNKVVLDGVLERGSSFKNGDVISIKLTNGYLFEQSLTEDLIKVNLADNLFKGDIVKITLNSGRVTEVEYTGYSVEASGRLVSITISENPSLTLVDQKGRTRTFAVSRAVAVKSLGAKDTNGIYALRLDQDITVHLDGLIVNEIEIIKAVDKTEFEATITEVHSNINLIKATDENGKEWIISLEGSNQQIHDYTVGDRVYVYGVELSSDLFEADLVIILD